MSEMNIRCPWPGWKLVKALGGGSFGTVFEMQRQLLDGSILVCNVPQQARRVLDAAGIGRLVTIR